MPYADFKGNVITGKLVAADTAKLLAHMQSPEVQREMGRTSAPTQAELAELVTKRRLISWELVGKGGSIGFASIIKYDGSPYVHIEFLRPEAGDMDAAADALVGMAKQFFESEPTFKFLLFMPARQNVDDDAFARISETGFDSVGFVSGWDMDKRAGFVMMRSTYDAYYGEGSEAS